MALGISVLRHRLVVYTLFLSVVLMLAIFVSHTATAAVGVNQQLNFQGRLLNSQGATVPDGYYNMEFKVYQDGDGQSAGDTTGTPAGSLLWTEDHMNVNSQAITVLNGYFSVQLGSICSFNGGSCQGYSNTGINWNSDTLWLSMNVGGTNATCTPFSGCTPDGEMLPMKRLSANSYAFNSKLLGGLSSSNFVQLAQGLQTDGTNTTSIYINKTGTGNILDLQSSGTDAFTVNNIGDLTFGSNNNHTLSVATGAAGAAGKTFSLLAGAAGTGASPLAGGNLTVAAGAGGGTNGNGGNVSIDAGAANGTGTDGTVSVGSLHASSIQVGNTTSAIAQTITIGNNNTTGSTDTITIGNLNGTSTTTINGGSGNINLATNQAGSGTTVKTATNNSSVAFQVQNSASGRVFGVDTSSNLVQLGQSSTLNGTLVFRNSASANSITLNSTSANSNYTLTLPSAAPATGLCIETSTGNANQLVFASCSNNNASIQEVQEWDANNTNVVTVSPATIGDEMVLTTQIPTGGVTVSSISGGGVSTWNKIVTSAGNGTVNRVEMWGGTVTSLGSSSITVTYSSSPGSEEVTATEFTAAGVNSSTSWGIESSSSQLNSTSSTSVTYPSLTSVNGSELYIGYAQVQNPPATAGSNPAFNYIITSTQHNVIAYDTSLTANATYQPAANQNTAGQSNTVAAVLTAFVTSTSINNTTSLQKANFYVQAANSGSVAGVLQAASAGTADIFDLRNSGAANVLAVSSAGSLTLKSAASSTALQVQNSSGYGVMSVDTSNNKVVLGSSNQAAGMLSFNDVSDSNSISLVAPSSVATSYQLTLPSNTPTAGLCLGTSPSNANQLIFASCTTQVSAASVSYINKWSTNGSGVTTLSDSPASVGNLVVFFTHTANAVNVNSISGGGVASWTKINAYSGGGTPGNIEMWRGVVTTTGAGTITVTYSGTAGTNEIAAQEFSMGSSNGTWAIDTSGSSTTTSSVTTVNYPSLTPVNSNELYAGYAYGGGTMSAGTSTGFTYLATSASKYLAYNTNVTGGTAYTPTATQTAGVYASVAAIIEAYTGTSVIVNTTAAQEANFNVQAANAGSVAGVLQAASSGTADVLQLKNSSGINIASINASSGVTLGTSNSLSGQLNFAASGNNNLITVNAPSLPGASYSLTLPTTTPAAGQCLATSPNNSSQLVFSSCANQVSSVAITYVNSWNTTGGSPVSLNVSPAALGDLLTVFVNVKNCSLNTVTAITGGGVSTWSKVTSGNCLEMWRGQVTSTGSSTISTTIGGPNGVFEVAAQEWTSGANNGSWVVDTSNDTSNASSTTVSYPSLTPQSSKDLYIGYASGSSTMSAGSTSGFSYFAGAQTTTYGTYDTSVSATSQPTASQATAGTSATIGALIAAYSSSSVIANSTVTQEANFNIQAASNGTVAGVLQAASSGTADVFNILNAAGTLTDSFSNTGNLLIKPSTASASAFRVQTTGGANVLSTDTTSNLVVIGAGATGEPSPSLLVVDNETGTTADPSVLNGAMYYNATDHVFRCGVDGAWQNCDGLMYANTSNSTVNNNCSSSCSAFTTTTTIPANYCQTGRVIKLSAAGYFSSLATTSNLQFGVYYGTSSTAASSDTLLGTLPPAVSVASANNNYFQMTFNIVCFSTSTMQSSGLLSIQTGSASSGVTSLPLVSTSGTTVVTSSAKNLYIFPIWDTASTSNTATLTQFEVSGL